MIHSLEWPVWLSINPSLMLMDDMHDTNATENAFAKKLSSYGRQIDKEDELVNERIQWLLMSQAILFAAMALESEAIRKIVQPVIPFVGLASSLAIWASVIAAIITMCRYRQRLFAECSSYAGDRSGFPECHRKWSALILGWSASFCMPPFFAAAWCYVLIE
jgi:hypothetical protein